MTDLVDGLSSPAGGRMPRVLLLCPRVVGTFIRQDAQLLQTEFDVSLFPDQGWRSLPTLRNVIRAADAVLVWFAGRHALPAIALARQCRVPVATVVGGYEVAWIPEIAYGIRPQSIRERILRRLLRASDIILTVSNFSDQETRTRFPEVAEKTRCIRHAVDASRFQMVAALERHGVLCVGNISREALAVKGWPLFWEVARRLPHESFVAVGPARDVAGRAFVASRPPNLQWRGELTGDELRREFQTASVYFQGSRQESFCVALAEAMACGCIPAVARRGALPEVAGDIGYYFDPRVPEEAADAVKKALEAPPAQRLATRQRVIDLFGLERRRCELVDAIRGILGRRA
jgi:glycosyltransferase involved in cell wall biosynthesis